MQTDQFTIGIENGLSGISRAGRALKPRSDFEQTELRQFRAINGVRRRIHDRLTEHDECALLIRRQGDAFIVGWGRCEGLRRVARQNGILLIAR